jgi:16S rRNA (adenine1518-N6/adenine1519-N6)-dimethyltransferase
MMPPPDGQRARKRFGQHFLVDSFVVDAIVNLVSPAPTDRILEIGPGGGILTEHLIASGAELVAVEIDRGLAARLEERFASTPGFTLYTGDILKFDFGRLDGPARAWKVCGNLPYNISTPLLARLLEHAPCFSAMILMVQKEVAERLGAEPGTKAYGRLSVLTQRRADVIQCLDIGPESFQPPPKVDSAVVELRPREDDGDADFERWLGELVRSAFSTRRKTLANTLRGHATAAQFAQCGIDPGARAEQLSVADFVRLARATRKRDPNGA